MPKQLCNHPTPMGPCTMPKGHRVEYHRHREYEVMDWEIRIGQNKLESGTNRVPLNYAIKDALDKYSEFTVVIKKRKKVS